MDDLFTSISRSVLRIQVSVPKRPNLNPMHGCDLGKVKDKKGLEEEKKVTYLECREGS